MIIIPGIAVAHVLSDSNMLRFAFLENTDLSGETCLARFALRHYKHY